MSPVSFLVPLEWRLLAQGQWFRKLWFIARANSLGNFSVLTESREGESLESLVYLWGLGQLLDTTRLLFALWFLLSGTEQLTSLMLKARVLLKLASLQRLNLSLMWCIKLSSNSIFLLERC